jgi:hypothetical protein
MDAPLQAADGDAAEERRAEIRARSISPNSNVRNLGTRLQMSDDRCFLPSSSEKVQEAGASVNVAGQNVADSFHAHGTGLDKRVR